MIPALDQFSSIGWDFDGTLIDNPNSVRIQNYITTHPEKTHSIITFRTHGMQNTIFLELNQKYPNSPDKKHFEYVINFDDERYLRYYFIQRARAAHRFSGPLTPDEIYYRTWKGMVCKQHNIQVIVDDKPEDVLPGCYQYGISFIDSFSLK